MYDIKFLWLFGLYFELRIGLIFQYTQVQLRSWRINPISANPTKWSKTLKQFVGNLPTNCLSVFDRFVKLALKGLSIFAS